MGKNLPRLLFSKGTSRLNTVFFLFPNMEKASPPGPFESVSEMLETYYASRDVITRIRQKSADLRKIVQTALDRNRKN
mgnify:CR=1 FL=1